MHSLRQRVSTPEWLDLPGHDPALLAVNLADLAWVNRWLGGTWLTLRALDRLTASMPVDRPLKIVDLATGGADLPRAVAAWAARRGMPVSLVASDVSPLILQLAARSRAGIAFVAGDMRRLPFNDSSCDIVICSLALHHLAPGEAVAALAEMRRIARRAIIVTDVVRSCAGYLGAWLVSHALSSNPLTRHDGPLSIRRAYTHMELRTLMHQAGLPAPLWASSLGYRVAFGLQLAS